jgi:hypothetical protein
VRSRLALLFCIALLAGCGESDEEQFRDDFDPINERLSDLGEEVGDALQAARSKSNTEIAEQFDGFAEDIADIGQDVEELDPPEDLQDEVDRLEGAIADVETALTTIADAGESGDAKAARAATVDLIDEGERLDKLQGQLLDATE